MTAPRHAAPETGGTQPLTLAVGAVMRDNKLDILGHVNVRFIYDPADPYALEMGVRTPFHPGEKKWTASREVFCAAALWGLELPGLDLTVTSVVITRARPGHPTRDVPCLRVTLREYEDCGNGVLHRFTGHAAHFDITTADVQAWFATLTQVVRIGQEHRHIDVDATIAQILGHTHQEGQ